MKNLALLVSPRQEKKLLYEVLHILSLGADGSDAFFENLRVGAAPARQEIRIPEDDRHRGPQFMRGIRDETLLLLKAAFETVEHMIECRREFREFIMCRRHLDAAVHALDFNLARRLCKVTYRLQDAAAQEVAGQQSNDEANNRDDENQLLQMLQKIIFRRNGTEKMHLINLTMVHDVHGRMINREPVKRHDIHALIRPERRIFHAVLFHHIQRRIA